MPCPRWRARSDIRSDDPRSCTPIGPTTPTPTGSSCAGAGSTPRSRAGGRSTGVGWGSIAGWSSAPKGGCTAFASSDCEPTRTEEFTRRSSRSPPRSSVWGSCNKLIDSCGSYSSSRRGPWFIPQRRGICYENADCTGDLGEPMRVLVLTVDGLQPAYLGPYGNEWVPTPTLDHWAASGVVFDWHFADSPDLDSARRSWRSGRHSLAAEQSESDL